MQNLHWTVEYFNRIALDFEILMSDSTEERSDGVITPSSSQSAIDERTVPAKPGSGPWVCPLCKTMNLLKRGTECAYCGQTIKDWLEPPKEARDMGFSFWDIFDFRLSELTALGWVLMFVTVEICLAATAGFACLYVSWLPPSIDFRVQPSQALATRILGAIVGVPILLFTVACFLITFMSGLVVLRVAGLQAIKEDDWAPEVPETDQHVSRSRIYIMLLVVLLTQVALGVCFVYVTNILGWGPR